MKGRKPDLGEAVKRLRARLGVSMAEVSRRAGLAVSTLSKVEAGQMSLTYDKLVQLAAGLDVDIAELFDSNARAPQVIGRRSINRRDQGTLVETPNYDHLYLSTEVAGKRLVPLIVEHKASSPDAFSDFIRHGGEEFVYVLQGEVEVHTEFYRPVVLQAGESIWLDSMMGHFYLARGEETARVLAVCLGPESELMAAFEEVEAKDAERAPSTGPAWD